MWIVYQRKDRKVVGMSALCEPDLAKETALTEVVKGLADGGSVEKYDALQVQDSAEALTLMSAPFEHITVAESKGRVKVTIEAPKAPPAPPTPAAVTATKPARMSFLQFSCDAPQVHPVDGLPGIEADGTSFTTITVRKVDEAGMPRTSRSDNDELYLRTTAGTILSADGRSPAARIKLKQGEGSFRLVSDTTRRVATVSVFNGDSELSNSALHVEFI